MNNDIIFLFVGAGSPIIAFITFWMALSAKIATAIRTAEEALNKAKELHTELEAIRTDHSSYRERASERFASAVQVSGVETEVNKNLLAINGRLDTLQRDLYARLDTVVGLIKLNGNKHP